MTEASPISIVLTQSTEISGIRRINPGVNP